MTDQRYLRRGFYFWITGIALWAVVAWWFFPPPPRPMVERYFSRGWYRWTLDWTTPVTQAVPFPVVMLLLAAFLSVFLLLWIRNLLRSRQARKRSSWSGVLWGPKQAFVIAPLLLVWFIVFWGAGYQRLPVEERLHLDTAAFTDDEAARLGRLLLDEIRRNSTPPQDRDTGRSVSAIATAMAGIVGSWDGLPIDLPYRVKPTPKGFLLFNSTSGISSPFTLEPLVDGGLPDAAFVYTAAHELGHIAGFCAEDEATLIGYVAGLAAQDRFARYACALSAYVDLAGRLEEGQRRAAFEALPDIARQDLEQADEAYLRYRVAWFSRIGWLAYDKYLQAQGIREGMRNYSRGITLLGEVWRKGLVRF